MVDVKVNESQGRATGSKFILPVEARGTVRTACVRRYLLPYCTLAPVRAAYSRAVTRGASRARLAKSRVGSSASVQPEKLRQGAPEVSVCLLEGCRGTTGEVQLHLNNCTPLKNHTPPSNFYTNDDRRLVRLEQPVKATDACTRPCLGSSRLTIRCSTIKGHAIIHIGLRWMISPH